MIWHTIGLGLFLLVCIGLLARDLGTLYKEVMAMSKRQGKESARLLSELSALNERLDELERDATRNLRL